MMRTLRRRLHVSWLLAVVSVGVVVGVASAKYASQPGLSSVAWLLTGLLGLILIAAVSRVYMIVVAVVAGMLIGLWRGSVATNELYAYSELIGKSVSVTATISDDIDTNARGQLVMRLAANTIDSHPLKGSLWVTTNGRAKLRRSDHVIVEGKLSDGFGSFAATMYNARLVKAERPTPGDVAIDVRDWFAVGVQTAIHEPQSSLGLGFLLGERRGLPDDLNTALKAAGLVHIVVASGYNLTILVRLGRRLFEKVSKYLSFMISSALIVGFIGITGLSPSMSRAGLVTGLSLIAWYYGRKIHPLVLLPFAMAVTVLIQPSYAWGDLGWQLSFAAFGGVMIVAPLLKDYFFADMKIGLIRQILLETLAAELCTLPVLLLAFGQVSIIAPIANLLIVPLVPLAMALTFIAGLSGLIVPTAAHVFGLPGQVLLSYMTASAEYTGNLSWAVQHVQITPVTTVLMYVGIGAFTIFMWLQTRTPLRETNITN